MKKCVYLDIKSYLLRLFALAFSCFVTHPTYASLAEIDASAHSDFHVECKEFNLTFNFTKYQMSGNNYYIVQSSDRSNPCLRLKIHPTEKIIELARLHADPQCVKLKEPAPGIGTCLLAGSIILAKHLGATAIELEDASHIVVDSSKPGDEGEIELGPARLITKGETWYGYYGFIPKLEEDQRRYAEVQIFLKMATAVDIAEGASDQMTEKVEALLPQITNENMLAITYLNSLLQHTPKIFAQCYRPFYNTITKNWPFPKKWVLNIAEAKNIIKVGVTLTPVPAEPPVEPSK